MKLLFSPQFWLSLSHDEFWCDIHSLRERGVLEATAIRKWV
jgi:hypothetical protein